MKKILVSLVCLVALPLYAEKVDVEVDTSRVSQEGTTIEVKKGTSTSNRNYEITENDEEVEGEGANLRKEAKANWKQACREWRKEVRELNKENHVISFSCGRSECSQDQGTWTCRSTAKTKVRVKVQ